MARIGTRKDLPGLGNSIASIQRILMSERAHMSALTDGVLKDVGLTAKLLRLINAASYRSAGGGQIVSIQRALALMGFQAVGRTAASLILFDKLPKGVDGARVREEFSRALLAGLLAQELCRIGSQLERSYLAGLFHNLGRILLALHFPDEARQIAEQTRACLVAQGLDLEGPMAVAEHHRSSRAILGLTTEELSIAVATDWGWPDELLHTLRSSDPEPDAGPLAGVDYLRALATASSDLSARLHLVEAVPASSDQEAAERRAAVIQAFASRMARPLALDAADTEPAVERGRSQWQSLGQMLGMDSVPDRQRAMANEAAAAEAAAAATRASRAPQAPVNLKPPVLAAGAGSPRAPALSQGRPTGPAPSPQPAGNRVQPSPLAASAVSNLAQGVSMDRLARALERASVQALSTAALAEVASLVLDDLLEAMSLQSAVLCLRTPEGGLRGRFGSGLGPEAKARRLLDHFDVPLGRERDLFSVLCQNARDTLISDATQPNIASRLPPWYLQHIAAPTFLVLPLRSGTRVEGMLYFDRSTAGSLQLDEQRLALLGALRNQMLVAIRLRQAAA